MRGIAVIYPNYLDSTNLLLLAFAAVDLDVDPSTAQRHRSVFDYRGRGRSRNGSVETLHRTNRTNRPSVWNIRQ